MDKNILLSDFNYLNKKELKNYLFYFRKYWLKKMGFKDSIKDIHKLIKRYNEIDCINGQYGIFFAVDNIISSEDFSKEVEYKEIVRGDLNIILFSPNLLIKLPILKKVYWGRNYLREVKLDKEEIVKRFFSNFNFLFAEDMIESPHRTEDYY